MKLSKLLVTGTVVLAGTAGALTATALSGSSAQEPARTVTIHQITGPQGPLGPPGADGTPGAESCPSGSTFGKAVFPQQGQGPIEILTCIVD